MKKNQGLLRLKMSQQLLAHFLSATHPVYPKKHPKASFSTISRNLFTSVT